MTTNAILARIEDRLLDRYLDARDGCQDCGEPDANCECPLPWEEDEADSWELAVKEERERLE